MSRLDDLLRTLVEQARDRARAILDERRATLDALAAALETRETLDGSEVTRIVTGELAT